MQLAHTTTPERVERACARAQAFGAADYATVKRILHEGLDQQALPPPLYPVVPPARGDTLPPLRAYTFVRQAGEFMSALLGGAR